VRKSYWISCRGNSAAPPDQLDCRVFTDSSSHPTAFQPRLVCRKASRTSTPPRIIFCSVIHDTRPTSSPSQSVEFWRASGGDSACGRRPWRHHHVVAQRPRTRARGVGMARLVSRDTIVQGLERAEAVVTTFALDGRNVGGSPTATRFEIAHRRSGQESDLLQTPSSPKKNRCWRLAGSGIRANKSRCSLNMRTGSRYVLWVRITRFRLLQCRSAPIVRVVDGQTRDFREGGRRQNRNCARSTANHHHFLAATLSRYEPVGIGVD